MINGVNITATDLLAGNGVVHVVDTVLVPTQLLQSSFNFASAGLIKFSLGLTSLSTLVVAALQDLFAVLFGVPVYQIAISLSPAVTSRRDLVLNVVVDILASNIDEKAAIVDLFENLEPSIITSLLQNIPELAETAIDSVALIPMDQ
eukprot:3877571-Rhodomonas_salina.1